MSVNIVKSIHTKVTETANIVARSGDGSVIIMWVPNEARMVALIEKPRRKVWQPIGHIDVPNQKRTDSDLARIGRAFANDLVPTLFD